MTPREFELLAAKALSERFGTSLRSRKVRVGAALKTFDFVSADEGVIGDAKFYSNCKVPSGKLATITEFVWLLEKCRASRRFIVFGNDIRLPAKWLNRFGSLLEGIEFYFLEGHRLERLN